MIRLPIWGASQLLNMPLLTMYRFGIYGLVFLLGYFVFPHGKIQDAVEKIHIPMLILAVVFGVCYTTYYFGTDYASPQCLQSLLTNVYLWTATIAILGCGKAWFNFRTKFSQYMTGASFGIYILHYPIVMAVCYLLIYHCRLPSYLDTGVGEAHFCPMTCSLC